jgi:hypothetical protein
METSNIKIFVAGTLVGLTIGFGTMTYNNHKIDTLPSLYEVRITNEYINIRKKPSVAAEKVSEVLQDEEYKIYEVYEDDERYIWYKIKLKNSDRRFGWIASNRNNPYLEVIK